MMLVISTSMDSGVGRMSTKMENVVRLEARQDATPGPSSIETPGPSASKRGRRVWIVSAAALAIGAAGALWITSPASSQTTDDAYISADSTTVAPKVAGLVSAVLVPDNASVRAGQPLVQIDPEEFDAKVRAAKADLADSLAAISAAQAALLSLDAEEQLAAAQIHEAGTSIRSADAEASRADADRNRTDILAKQGFASRQTVDSFRSQAISAEQAATRARASLAVAERQASLTSSKRGSLMADLQKAQARKLAAEAALDLVRQDRAHSLISAPVDGVVGNRQVHVGDYVQAGTQLLTLVPLRAVYVTANFKETQVRDMRVGQSVRIKVDAVAKPFNGTVESFAPGSGSTFSLLPFEPGTGNFTKIVQRVPVRIRLEPNQAGLNQLRVGLSANVTVRVRP
jgi:membrane fusion protein (multidrug efflux system)